MPPLLVLIPSLTASLALSAPGPHPDAPAPGRPVAGVTCSAAPPTSGTVFAGPVLHVFDGRTFCVAQGPTPSEWVRVTLAGEDQGATRSTLMAATFARRVVCQAEHRDRGGVVARCVLDDAPLDRLLENPSIRAEAAAWR